MSLGEKLCNARLAKKETTSQVAAATRMKVQIVEDLEKEDFQRLAAPIYAKGFIKLYSEHVGLDPAPLIEEYMARHQSTGTAAPKAESQSRVHKILNKQSTDLEPEEDPVTPETDLFDYVPESKASQRPLSSIGSSLSSKASPEVSEQERKPSIDIAAVAGSVRDRISECTARLVDAFRSARQNSAAKNGPKKLNWMPLAIAGAVLVALTLIAVSIKQCSPSPDNNVTVTVPPEPEELRVAVDPPPPYFD